MLARKRQTVGKRKLAALPLGPERGHNGAMSKPSDNPADPFKKALTEATKVMADDPELGVTFSVDPRA